MWKYLTSDKYDEILSSFNLLNTTDIKKINKILYNISNNIDANYSEIIIKKKTHGIRFLYEPSKTLKDIQKRILKNILEERKLSSYSYAYRKNLSVFENAKPHVGKNIVLKLDIKDFFGNINFNMVYDTCFNEMFFPKKLGVLLTNLCVYNNKLPQGAPTSGYISNLVMRSFDEKIGKYCDEKKISYTRYSDDMSFSGDFNIKEIISLVERLLKENGFKLNKKKIKVVSKKTRQQITGIVVNEKINIRKSYKKKIRQEVYYINKYGLDSHLANTKYKSSKKEYLMKLLGKVNYIYSITKEQEFKNYKDVIVNLLKKGTNKD